MSQHPEDQDTPAQGYAKKDEHKKRDRKDRRKALVASMMMAIFGRLPIAINRIIGGMIGRLTWYFGSQAAQSSLKNIQDCFPDLDETRQRALAKASIICTAKTALEVTYVWSQPYKKIKHLISGNQQFTGIQGKLDQGVGVLLLVPHLGNWEILSSVLPQCFDFTAMYQPTGIEKIDAFMIAGRTREGCKLAPTNRKGVSHVLKQLHAAKIVAILPDQVPDESGGELSPFFGKPALTMTLVHKLVQRTQCQVLMLFAKQVKSGFEMIIREPDPDIYDTDQAKSLAAMNRSVESCVLEAPEQYQWEYKRFKRAD